MFHMDVIKYIESGEYLRKNRPDLKEKIDAMKRSGYVYVKALPNRAVLALTLQCRLKLASMED